ncbi:PAC2 family protein [Candidatus Bathyarchaeota archaeon]|nr:PAC2 family protein [Candidatus Bathyarchaeota archaeon]
MKVACAVKQVKKPQLKNPLLLEGLPGIGLVANIAVAYLIRKLNAEFFAEIVAPSFPDVSITEKDGSIKTPFCHLYYHKSDNNCSRDLILLYGNTQALSRRGQYGLCGCILDLAESLDCQKIITLGGYRPGRKVSEPALYYAASDLETAREVEKLGAQKLSGQIYGVAGLLVGLAGLRGMKGFCLLAETEGTSLDVDAAKAVLKALSDTLGLKLKIDDLKTAEDLADFLSPFDFGAIAKEQIREGPKPNWFI